MAADAVIADAAVIHARRFPESVCVAVPARGLDRDMHRGRVSLGSGSGAGMTLRAVPGCPLELTAHVATLAVCEEVASVQWEAREVVVERGSDRGRGVSGCREPPENETREEYASE